MKIMEGPIEQIEETSLEGWIHMHVLHRFFIFKINRP